MSKLTQVLERTGWTSVEKQSYDDDFDAAWYKSINQTTLVLHQWSAGVAGKTWYSYDIELRDQLGNGQSMRLIAYGNDADLPEAELEEKIDNTCRLLSNAWQVITQLKEVK